MTARSITALAIAFAIALLAPNSGHAQTFKVDKFDIKGDGGADYVTVEAATERVFVSRGTHTMVVEGRHRQSARRLVATVELEDTAPERRYGRWQGTSWPLAAAINEIETGRNNVDRNDD